jgi:[NiFe] hydrogenase assembly HybE family chaperone
MAVKRMRKPAFTAPPAPPAKHLADDPSALLTRFYDRVWREQMHDLPFVNPALSVEAIGFQRYEGDWVGAMVTPWFLNIFLIPGGGTLWRDMPSGEQRTVAFPVGELDFIADNNPNPEAPITAYQYCPLMHPVQHLPDQATARQAARDAMAALMRPPPVPESPAEAAVPEAAPAPAPAEPKPARRAFLRGIVGRS